MHPDLCVLLKNFVEECFRYGTQFFFFFQFKLDIHTGLETQFVVVLAVSRSQLGRGAKVSGLALELVLLFVLRDLSGVLYAVLHGGDCLHVPWSLPWCP